MENNYIPDPKYKVISLHNAFKPFDCPICNQTTFHKYTSEMSPKGYAARTMFVCCICKNDIYVERGKIDEKECVVVYHETVTYVYIDDKIIHTYPPDHEARNIIKERIEAMAPIGKL